MDKIEQMIQDRGLTGTRLKDSDLEANIVGEMYFTLDDRAIEQAVKIGEMDFDKLKRCTVCVLTLKNGFTTVGVNEGPVSASLFNLEIARTIARDKAKAQMWPLMAYARMDQQSKKE